MSSLTTYVLFCDDVRQEIGEKKTYVGVYGADLFVPFLPSVLPRFCAVTTLICYRGETPKKVVVRLVYAGQEIGSAEISKEELDSWDKAAEEELSKEVREFPADDPPKHRLICELVVSPFIIDKEGRLESHVETDTGNIRAGSLKILHDPDEDSPAIPLVHSRGRESKTKPIT